MNENQKSIMDEKAERNTNLVIAALQSYMDRLYELEIAEYDRTKKPLDRIRTRHEIYWKATGYCDRLIDHYTLINYNVITDYIESETKAILDAVPTYLD